MAPSPGGAPVVADIYNRVQTAVTNAGAFHQALHERIQCPEQQFDQYGQWYSQHVESIRNAGGAVTGIATEYYNSPGVARAAAKSILPRLRHMAESFRPGAAAGNH